MLRSKITNLRQGPTRDLIEHIENFRSKVDAYLGVNGSMDEDEQARQLVTSLNQEWSEKGCFFLDLGHVTFTRIETELKKSYQTKKTISGQNNHSSRMIDNTDANMGRRLGRWQTCNRNKCLGQDHPTKPHHHNECYHNPNNAGKMEDWKKAKQQAGEWIEYPRGSSRGRGRGQSSYSSRSSHHHGSNNYPPSEEIASAFENLRLEDREMGYSAEVHGKFLCSAQPQLACRGDQCSSIGLLDTGSSHFMFHDRKMFDDGTLVLNTDPNARLNLAGGGATLDIHSIGSVTTLNSKGEPTTYDECLYVPKLSRNLIPGGRLLRSGAVTVLLDDPNFRIEKNGKELFSGRFVGEGSLMYVPIRTAVRQDNSTSSLSSDQNRNGVKLLKLHYSLGHPSE